jgi:mono/diheme cytochrome c family protein
VRQSGSTRAWVLAFILGPVIGLGGLLALGCAMDANACPFGDQAPTPASATGQEIYQINCATCHGVGGQGGRGPSLVLTTLTPEEITSKIGRGSPGLMPRYKGKLTPEQIERVTAYVVSLKEDRDE